MRKQEGREEKKRRGEGERGRGEEERGRGGKEETRRSSRREARVRVLPHARTRKQCVHTRRHTHVFVRVQTLTSVIACARDSVLGGVWSCACLCRCRCARVYVHVRADVRLNVRARAVARLCLGVGAFECALAQHECMRASDNRTASAATSCTGSPSHSGHRVHVHPYIPPARHLRSSTGECHLARSPNELPLHKHPA